jgi:hypothetical protein
MDGFDVTKYQGRWYENAFHDYTQFTEVYDTTLDIELSPDKKKVMHRSIVLVAFNLIFFSCPNIPALHFHGTLFNKIKSNRILFKNNFKKWLDDFGLKGPSPRPNPLSWDKSPVANGAHYFLYGKLDPENANSGVLQVSSNWSLVWFGLVWFGLVWFGLVWCVLCLMFVALW